MLKKIVTCFTILNLFFGFSFVWAFQDKPLDVLIQQSKTRASVVKEAQKAVVNVKVEKIIRGRSFGHFNNPFELFDDELLERLFPELRKRKQAPDNQREYKQEGMGSGSIIDKNGYILTNNHVVGEADKIMVKLSDEREFEAELVGTDPQSDIAVIKIDGENLPTLPMGNSDNIQVAESVIAIGNPFGLSQTVTMGIVSAKGRFGISALKDVEYQDFIQTDAAINQGNSGGPLINLKGEIIGVNTAIFSKTGGSIGIGFAVSINLAKKIMNDLINKGVVSRGWLGVMIQDLSPDLVDAFELKNNKGVLITGVMPDTPAEISGMLKGDVVIEIDGKPVKNTNDLRNTIANTDVGNTIILSLIRKGKLNKINVTLGERPQKLSQQKLPKKTEEKLGIKVQNLTPEMADNLKYDINQGVIITEVEPFSLAAEKGLYKGLVIVEVNRHPINDIQNFRTEIEKGNLQEGYLLLVYGQRGSQYIVLREK